MYISVIWAVALCDHISAGIGTLCEPFVFVWMHCVSLCSFGMFVWKPTGDMSPLVLSYAKSRTVALSPSCCRLVAPRGVVLSPSWSRIVALSPLCCRLVTRRGIVCCRSPAVVLSRSCCRIVAVDFLRVQLPCFYTYAYFKKCSLNQHTPQTFSLKCSVAHCMSGNVSMSIYFYLLIIVGLLQLKFFIAKSLWEIKNLPSTKYNNHFIF